jgi:hypothetical protein
VLTARSMSVRPDLRTLEKLQGREHIARRIWVRCCGNLSSPGVASELKSKQKIKLLLT